MAILDWIDNTVFHTALGLAIIMLAWAAGGAVTRFTDLPLPSSIMGLIILSGALFSGLIRIEWVEKAGDYLLRHMMLFFVPVVVGVVAYGNILTESYVIIAIVLVVPLLGVLILSAFVARMFGMRADSKDETS